MCGDQRRCIEECFDRTNKQETTTRHTKDQMKRHSGKGYETGRRECNDRLDVGQRKMERLTSGNAGPQRTVKLLKKNYNKSLATLRGLNWFYKKYLGRSWVIIFRALFRTRRKWSATI